MTKKGTHGLTKPDTERLHRELQRTMEAKECLVVRCSECHDQQAYIGQIERLGMLHLFDQGWRARDGKAYCRKCWRLVRGLTGPV